MCHVSYVHGTPKWRSQKDVFKRSMEPQKRPGLMTPMWKSRANSRLWEWMQSAMKRMEGEKRTGEEPSLHEHDRGWVRRQKNLRRDGR